MERDNPLDSLILKSPKNTEDENKKVEDIRKIIEEWLHNKHINAKTRLTKNQVIAISILKTLADRYHIRPLQLLLKNYQTFKLSDNILVEFGLLEYMILLLPALAPETF